MSLSERLSEQEPSRKLLLPVRNHTASTCKGDPKWPARAYREIVHGRYESYSNIQKSVLEEVQLCYESDPPFPRLWLPPSSLAT